MTPKMFCRFLSLCVLVASIAALAEDNPLSISEPWIRAAPPGAMVLAGYMTLRNVGKSEITIDKVSSPDFAMIEMHRTVVQNGMARMLPQHSLVIPAGGELILHPGGLHLMMMQPKRDLRAGDAVELSLHNNGARVVTTKALVKK